jgi:hypothetical protein
LDLSSLSANGMTMDIASASPGILNLDSDWSLDFVHSTGGISGFDAGKFDLSAVNTFLAGGGLGSLAVAQSGNNLLLNYTAAVTPEPGTLAMLIAAGMGLAIWARKRK